MGRIGLNRNKFDQKGQDGQNKTNVDRIRFLNIYHF